MSNKFENVPVDEDTTIFTSLEAEFGDYCVLYQAWSWDGINAESIIFCTEDIKHLSKGDLLSEVSDSSLIKAEFKEQQITYKQNKDFTYVNFNFEISD